MIRSRFAGGAAFALVFACAPALSPRLSSAWAADDDAGSAADGRAVLEEVCRNGGDSATTCSCLGDFVEAHFTPREIDGAAMVFSDPALADDPGAAIGALLSAGYDLAEITSVANRVVELETVAKSECAVEDDDAG